MYDDPGPELCPWCGLERFDELGCEDPEGHTASWRAAQAAKPPVHDPGFDYDGDVPF